ncbi:MAG: FAD:protein FMN transferase [Syntrophomonadaceae bacterium]|nr:FAD:protein FMN transferase [Syntrophomonadaceae bacterium]
MRKVVLLSVLSLIMIIVAGCGNKPATIQEYCRENFIMDTLIRIRVFSSDPESGAKALDEAFAEFARIGNLSDKFAEKNLSEPEISDVYRVNKYAGIKAVKVSEDTLAMLEKSQYFADVSNGAFDVTVGPVMDLWGFGQAQYHLPSDRELKQKLTLVGYMRIVINKQQKTVFLPQKGMSIDLGGIAKGYATDRAAQKLRQMGIKSAIINAGGNIYALGSKPDNSSWLAGIQDPREKSRLAAIIKVNDTAVVSSGDYERYFISKGIRYHHILDPSAGKPARKAISTTIVAPSAADADVLSTALFVLGPEKGMALLEKLPGIKAVFIDEHKNITYSPALQNQIDFTDGGGYQVILKNHQVVPRIAGN